MIIDFDSCARLDALRTSAASSVLREPDPYIRMRLIRVCGCGVGAVPIIAVVVLPCLEKVESCG